LEFQEPQQQHHSQANSCFTSILPLNMA
jgi:hypothetical protein